MISSQLTAVYNPKAFIPHAASLGQAFAHCRRFSTAATRRCLGSVSVPVSRVMLSHPVPIVALVGRYPTNKLIGRGPVPRRNHTFSPKTSSGITGPFGNLQAGAAIPDLGVGDPRVTLPFAARVPPKGPFRTTCMPNPRRQRSF